MSALGQSYIAGKPCGQLAKAMGRVTSFGLGDIEDPLIKQQLRDKFPPRYHPLPESVASSYPIDSFRNLRESLLTLNHGTAPGSGGIRNEFLTVLGERMTDQQIKLLEDLGLAYTSGKLPSWFYLLWLSLQTVAPFKTSEKTTVRPRR